MPQALVKQQGFGRPGHVLFMSEFGAEQVEPAIGAFVKMIGSDPEYRWTNNVIFAIGESSDPAHRGLIRDQYERFSVRSAVVMTLAEKPDVADYDPLATYRTEIAKNGAPEGVMPGTTAIASGVHRKGRVFCFSPHPERTAGLERLLVRAVWWTAGEDPAAERN